MSDAGGESFPDEDQADRAADSGQNASSSSLVPLGSMGTRGCRGAYNAAAKAGAAAVQKDRRLLPLLVGFEGFSPKQRLTPGSLSQALLAIQTLQRLGSP